MAKGSEIRPKGNFGKFTDIYGGAFEDAMNNLFSSANIRATATTIVGLETTYGDYEVGRFNRHLLPATVYPGDNGTPGGGDADRFERDFLSMPEDIRRRVSEVLRNNFRSANPMPVFYRTSTNVDQTHDAIVKLFVHGGRTYIGVLYLCPNPKRPA